MEEKSTNKTGEQNKMYERNQMGEKIKNARRT
jgi:hypothetical protein